MTKTVPTFEAKIYVGFGVSNDLDPEIDQDNRYWQARQICQSYCDKVGLCVTFEPLDYIYVNGWESGCVIGLINYPRFPDSPDGIRKKALELGELLRQELSQKKVSVVFPDKTVMLYEGDL